MPMKDLLFGLSEKRAENMDSLGLPIDDLIKEAAQDVGFILQEQTYHDETTVELAMIISSSIILGSRIIAAAILEAKK